MSFRESNLLDRLYRYLGTIQTTGHTLLASSIVAGACGLLSVVTSQWVLAATHTPLVPVISAMACGLPFLLVLGSSFILIRGYARLDRRNKILTEVADRDGLTRLANRAAFSRRGREMTQMARVQEAPMSLIMMDVDHFKMINDSHGHLAGDLALQHLASILGQSSRDGDLIARWGGEEFAVLLSAADIDGARAYAERVRKTVSETPMFWNGKELTLTLSAGVTEFNPEHDNLEDMIHRADIALYSAKGAGRNQVCHAPFFLEVIEGYEQDVEFSEASAA
ncbi:diguanylate cyclase (GGDEF) domain-containing protein [Cohaesibacter sp. ES.047]|uniref:GGDEF domain-containing protein n=1 Tax=Cohaesibacter sp. ES.047 TaxID=1798205 RepID=UPI000BC01E3D|nr:GGDEF domain-containing protein [Cohaesibacter sp. ES.047]SNY91908.1 diguanylate cyclase (GGDEF) domain-containing protein [Cohaesibacter sp. ES.047]